MLVFDHVGFFSRINIQHSFQGQSTAGFPDCHGRNFRWNPLISSSWERRRDKSKPVRASTQALPEKRLVEVEGETSWIGRIRRKATRPEYARKLRRPKGPLGFV